MRTSLTISGIGHATVLLWGAVTFAAKPIDVPPTETLPVDIISATEFSQITAGSKTAPKVTIPQPLVEKVAEQKPAEDLLAKVVETKKEVKAATDTPPTPPQPKLQKTAEKKPPEPKSDPIAEAIKKDDAKKPEPKPEPKKAQTPPKPAAQPPMFDPKQLQALLDKRSPQRVAAAGNALNDTLSLGTAAGSAAQLSQSEIDAFRRRVEDCWNPPAGVDNATKLHVVIRVLFKSDGSVARAPEVVSGSASPLGPAMADSAKRAILSCQPFKMLNPDHYDQWKDIEITFDPQHMLRG